MFGMKRKFVLCDEVNDTGSAGAPTVVPTVVPPQEIKPPVDSSTEVDDWASIIDLPADVDDLPSEKEGTIAPSPAPEVVSPAPAPVEPTPAAPSTPAEPVTPAQETPAAPAHDSAAALAAETAYREQLEATYRFDEETALQLQTEPEKVLPKLAAKLHMDVMQNVLSQVQSMLPQQLATVTDRMSKEREAENAFYTAYPDLKDHKDIVLQVGAMFRKLPGNEKIVGQAAIDRIGQMARYSLGLQQSVNTPPSNTVTPSQVVAAPYTPASAGRVTPPAPTQGEWEALIALDDPDD